jgi:2'-5' RNA ligase
LQLPPRRGGPQRVFFALWPDAAARERLAACARDVVRQVGGRAPRPENQHLTLAFVGAVEPGRIAALERVGAAAARTAAPFTLTLDRLCAFQRTGIAWLGARSLPDELTRLAQALREGLAAGAFPVDARPFAAHVTLARQCGTLAARQVPPVAWRVDRLALTGSELRPEGSRYREIAGWLLTGVG